MIFEQSPEGGGNNQRQASRVGGALCASRAARPVGLGDEREVNSKTLAFPLNETGRAV